MGSRLECNSADVRKRIENHTFNNEEGDEYEASTFGGFTDYMRRKKIKLQNLDAEIRSSSNSKPQIFRGVVAFVNGYTQPSLNDLHHLIVSHGGGFLQYLDGKTSVTHVIASSLTPKKKVEFQRYRIVKPAWVVESVKAGRILPWDAFRVVDEGVGQKVLGFDNGRMFSQANTQKSGYRDQTESSWYTSQLGAAALSRTPWPENSASAEPPATPTEADDVSHSDKLDAQDQDPLDFSPSDSNSVEKSLRDRSDASSSPPHVPATKQGQDVSRSTSERVRNGNLKRASIDEGDSASPSNVEKVPEPARLTAEEHNAILLSDPRMRKSSTVNPDFLKQYYQESRLHHLSTWKAELKAKLQALTEEKSSTRDRRKRAPGARRYVMHVDFDSFFAAVSLRKKPQLIEKAVVIAHGSGSGSEIASCNYPARKHGIKNGMWMKTAQQLCPDLHVLPYDFKAYEEASRHFYDSILATDGLVQSVSIDEALVDVTTQCLPAGGTDGRGIYEGSIYREQEEANKIAMKIRDLVMEKTGCAVSVGIGGNILLAKVACRKAKPAGQFQIKPESALDILGDLTVQELPGVAYSIGGKLEEIGVKYVKDIRNLTKERLVNALGPKTGEKIWDYSRGIDRVEVGEQVVRKSVSAEVNWGIRFVTQAQADEFIQSLCEELRRRLIENNVKGKQLTMKIMRRAADAPLDPPKHLGHGKCDTFNKSIVLGVATTSTEVLARESLSILKGFGFSPGELRGLGVQMTKLEPLKQFAATSLDSSQKRLQFKQPAVTPKEKASIEDPIIDDESPDKQGATAEPVQRIAGAAPVESEDSKPLNILGTQFMIPSQVDPEVLGELPSDIRARLQPKQNVLDEYSRQGEVPHGPSSRSQSPTTAMGLPSQSQLDPETLSELPEEVRNELSEYYSRSDRRHQAQQLLPQSPRKPITLPKKKVTLTPTKRKPGLLSRGKQSKTSNSNSTLTQSNFVSTLKASSNQAADTAPSLLEPEISPDFLAALPPDIRRELLDQQKRDRLKARSGLNLNPSTTRKKAPIPAAESIPAGQRKLKLQPRPERPTFTSKKLSTIAELRPTLSDWVEEFKDEGPFMEDVDALGSYLARVVEEERDLDKAVQIVKWAEWLVGSQTSDGTTGRSNWQDACENLKRHVRDAAQKRQMEDVVFE
ncbi:MAG: hypothetical protein Q9227_007994 [Pyrenula ochraceoflavens]